MGKIFDYYLLSCSLVLLFFLADGSDAFACPSVRHHHLLFEERHEDGERGSGNENRSFRNDATVVHIDLKSGRKEGWKFAGYRLHRRRKEKSVVERRQNHHEIDYGMDNGRRGLRRGGI